MATILAATSLDLNRAQKKEFLDEIGKSVGEVFRFYSIYYMPVNPEYCSECAVFRLPILCLYRLIWKLSAEGL